MIACLACCGLSALLLVFASVSTQAAAADTNWPAGIQVMLDHTKPLQFSRGQRLPLYLWPAMNPGPLPPEKAERLVRELDARGVGVVCGWDWNRRDASLAEAVTLARAQQKARILVNVDATALLDSFFNGDTNTAHVDAAGRSFWDDSFGKKDMGCPFALEHRRAAIRERVEWFAAAYRQQGLRPGFVWADWEIDGPLEWNGAWAASQRCRRCRERIPEIENFLQFQKTLRDLRADLQRDVYAAPLRARFPGVLVGNYAVHPHDGFRYWYDYFEKDAPELPGLSDQRARYRHWAAEFEGTDFTCAMPVVYTWERLYRWYDFHPPDYRWFYNLLLEASSVGRHTPPTVPIISFVHWHTTAPAERPDPAVKQMSEWAYQELLWHMLLRGTDTFYLWCPANEQAKEVQLLHPVWAAAQEYGEFLERGIPITFDVPKRPGPVVSGLQLADRVLVRRTDFAEAQEAVELAVRGRRLRVSASAGRCQVLELNR